MPGQSDAGMHGRPQGRAAGHRHAVLRLRVGGRRSQEVAGVHLVPRLRTRGERWLERGAEHPASRIAGARHGVSRSVTRIRLRVAGRPNGHRKSVWTGRHTCTGEPRRQERASGFCPTRRFAVTLAKAIPLRDSLLRAETWDTSCPKELPVRGATAMGIADCRSSGVMPAGKVMTVHVPPSSADTTSPAVHDRTTPTMIKRQARPQRQPNLAMSLGGSATVGDKARVADFMARN